MSDSGLDERFRIRFSNQRKKSGLSQEEVADLVGMQQQTIAKIELGTRKLRLEEIEELARAVGVSWRDLLADDEQRSRADLQRELRAKRENAKELLAAREQAELTFRAKEQEYERHRSEYVAANRALALEESEIVQLEAELAERKAKP